MLENISNSDCKAEREVEEIIWCKSMKVKVETPRLGGLCTTCYQTSTGLGRLDLRRSFLSVLRPFPRRERGSRGGARAHILKQRLVIEPFV